MSIIGEAVFAVLKTRILLKIDKELKALDNNKESFVANSKEWHELRCWLKFRHLVSKENYQYAKPT